MSLFKRFLAGFLLAFAAIVVVYFWAVGHQAPSISAAEPEKAAKWEYCSVIGDHKERCAWSKSDRAVTAESWKELADKLEVKFKDKDRGQQGVRMAILDRLGADGWELVSHSTMVMNATFIETVAVHPLTCPFPQRP
jgi:hypothetical protein